MTNTSCRENVEEAARDPAPMILRRFRPGDETAFRLLNEQWITRFFVLEDKDREVLGDPVTHILSPGGLIVFALIGGEVVGCCALVLEESGVYEVSKMAVSEQHRGAGIGRQILQFVIAEARAIGAARLHLETNSKLANAIHLYAAVGFDHIPPERLKPSLYARGNVFMEMTL